MTRKFSTSGDADIRRALRSWLKVKHAAENDTVVLEELGVCRGQVRIDLAVVNGLFHGYEIKSDRDSLRRLNEQVDMYGKVLDRATIVAGDHHLADILNMVPRWWGVLRFESGPKGQRLKTIRKGRRNPGVEPRYLVELLWLNDAITLLTGRDAARGVRGKPRHIVWDRVCEHFALHEIAASVRAHLKARVGQKGHSSLS